MDVQTKIHYLDSLGAQVFFVEDWTEHFCNPNSLFFFSRPISLSLSHSLSSPGPRVGEAEGPLRPCQSGTGDEDPPLWRGWSHSGRRYDRGRSQASVPDPHLLNLHRPDPHEVQAAHIQHL